MGTQIQRHVGSRQEQEQHRRGSVGPDHPHRGQPRNLHENRFRPAPRGGVLQHFFDLPRLFIFMQGKDPRDAHFITSRICGICGDNHATCSVYNQNMAYGVDSAAYRRVDHQPGRGRRVHVRPQHLPGEPGRRGFLREDGARNQSRRLGKGRKDRGAARRGARLSHHRRHHEVAQSRSRASSIAKRCR